ncbi:MAG: OsmC family protein [Streptosporangiales bacterium]|nr:OsmC family protein [Streptosporangiales bacterium]MBO0889684.1 OsmC family protein [Acidothermales bacterium]
MTETAGEFPAVRVTATLPVGAGYAVEVRSGRHVLHTDEPHEDGSPATGTNPVRMYLAALAACTAATMRMYAERKGLDAGEITVTVGIAPDGPIRRRITFSGELEPAVRERIAQIADRTPVTLLVTEPQPVDTEVTDATS